MRTPLTSCLLVLRLVVANAEDFFVHANSKEMETISLRAQTYIDDIDSDVHALGHSNLRHLNKFSSSSDASNELEAELLSKEIARINQERNSWATLAYFGFLLNLLMLMVLLGYRNSVERPNTARARYESATSTKISALQ